MNTVVIQSLDLMWKGMVSIFVVIAAIFLVTLLISRIRGKKENTDEQK